MAGALQQLVTETTRSQEVNGVVEQSVIDHVYTNCESRLTNVGTHLVGSSDHLGVVAQKVTRLAQDRPETIRTRTHHPDCMALFLADLYNNNVNQHVLECTDMDSAAATFSRELQYYSDKHTPVKTVQVRRQARPFVSSDTLDLIRRKKLSWTRFKKSGDLLAHQEFKALTKKVRVEMGKDRTEWLKQDLQPNGDPKKAWNKAK